MYAGFNNCEKSPFLKFAVGTVPRPVLACSFVAAVKGYKCIIVMPEGMSEERKKMDLAYGTEMVYTPGGESDVDLALEKLRHNVGRHKLRKTIVRSGLRDSRKIVVEAAGSGPGAAGSFCFERYRAGAHCRGGRDAGCRANR